LRYLKIKKIIEESSLSIQEIEDAVLEIGEFHKKYPNIQIIKEDQADNLILACALVASVNYIVSGDKHLVNLKKFQNIPILTPKQFLAKIK